MMSSLKLDNPVEKKAFKIMMKYPNRIPIICTKKEDSSIDKYLVPKDITIAEFIHIIRKRINLDQSKTLFLFIDNVIPPSNQTIYNIYNTYKHNDNFLYVTYCLENTFG